MIKKTLTLYLVTLMSASLTPRIKVRAIDPATIALAPLRCRGDRRGYLAVIFSMPSGQ